MTPVSTLHHGWVQATINHLIDELVGCTGRDNVIELITDHLDPLDSIGYTGLSLIETEGVATYSRHLRTGSLLRTVHPEELNPAAAAAKRGDLITYAVDDPPPPPYKGGDSRWDEIHDFFRKRGLIDVIFLPLVSSGERYGAIFLLSTRSGVFDESFVDQLEVLAAVIAMALEKAETIERADDRLAAIQSVHDELAINNRQLAEFAQIASTDLQDPLRKILTHSERLEASAIDQLEPREQDYLNRINSACTRMQRLVTDLLAFSSVHTATIADEPVKLDAILTDVLSDLEVAIDESGATVTIDSLPTVIGSETQLRQLFQNLIGNAIKFRNADIAPIITIQSLESPARVARIQVQGNGIGFDNKFVERIFKPFQRLHGSAAYQGSGIGLAVCRRIAERHGGRLQACSEPGHGATFVVDLATGAIR